MLPIYEPNTNVSFFINVIVDINSFYNCSVLIY